MKKAIFLYVLTACLLFSSCKKNTSTTPAPAQSGGYQSGGAFSVLRFYMYRSTTGLTQNENYAYANFYFNQDPINATNVFANGQALSLLTTGSYEGFYLNPPITPTTWSVTGTSLMPSFSYTNNDSIPKYTGYTLIPDTIYKNQINTIHINGVTGANEIGINVISLTSNDYIYIVNDTVALNNILKITPGDFTNQGFSTTCDSVQVNIELNKYNNQVINGHKFTFCTSLQIGKYVHIK